VPERVRIEAPDVRSATDLLDRLQPFDCRLVVHEDGRSEISVRSNVTGRELNKLIDDVLAAVDGWLAEKRLGAVVVHVGGERYSMEAPRTGDQIA
jgi:hypothetical protein